MIFEFLSSFDETLHQLGPDRHKRVVIAVAAFVEYFETRKSRPKIALRRLHGTYWQIRASLQDRVIRFLRS